MQTEQVVIVNQCHFSFLPWQDIAESDVGTQSTASSEVNFARLHKANLTGRGSEKVSKQRRAYKKKEDVGTGFQRRVWEMRGRKRDKRRREG